MKLGTLSKIFLSTLTLFLLAGESLLANPINPTVSCTATYKILKMNIEENIPMTLKKGGETTRPIYQAKIGSTDYALQLNTKEMKYTSYILFNVNDSVSDQSKEPSLKNKQEHIGTGSYLGVALQKIKLAAVQQTKIYLINCIITHKEIESEKAVQKTKDKNILQEFINKSISYNDADNPTETLNCFVFQKGLSDKKIPMILIESPLVNHKVYAVEIDEIYYEANFKEIDKKLTLGIYIGPTYTEGYLNRSYVNYHKDFEMSLATSAAQLREGAGFARCITAK